MQKSIFQESSVLSPVFSPSSPSTLTTWISHISHLFKNHAAQSKRRTAAQSALIAVATRHPDWADVAFDAHFLTHQGAPLIADYYRSGQLPAAAALADAWSNQFTWQSTMKLDAQLRFMPVAEDFVYILSTEAH